MRFLVLLLLLAGCARFDSLVPGQSSQRDVEALMGRPAEKRPGPHGETVLWYPQLPYGHASYAARIGPDGRLVALEQRLTEDSIGKVVKGATADEVRDLLGPPYQPVVYKRLEREVWTYPVRIPGHMYPKWFVVHLSLDDRTVREAFLMDDPQYVPRDTPGRRMN